jgi:hypothetical protein
VVVAKSTITQVTDDLDGSANAEEVSFAYNGTKYTIDLSRKNRTAFEKALKPYVEAGTKVASRSGSRRSKSKSSNGRRDLADVRAWAKQNGMKVSDRGRVSSSILDAYDAK